MAEEEGQESREKLPVVVGRRWRVLDGLAAEGEAHVTELARKLGSKIPDMSNYLDELVSYGLVLSRKSSGQHGQRKNVRLSPLGEQIHDFFKSKESSNKVLKLPTSEELSICLKIMEPRNAYSIEFQRMLAEKFVDLCRDNRVEETEEGKSFLKNLVIDPSLNGIDEKIAGRLRLGFALILGRMVKQNQGMQWLLKETYPAISKAAFNQVLPVKIRIDFVDALTRIYSSLPSQERTVLRRKLMDSYFSNSDPDLHMSLLEIIARARETEPDKSSVLKSIHKKLEHRDRTLRTRAEQLLGHFIFNWSMERYRTEGITNP